MTTLLLIATIAGYLAMDWVDYKESKRKEA